jgi:putative NIF3 family GTP cyclohydrolase 1 type 2
MTVREVIDAIIKKTGLEPLPIDKTCDQLMTGSFDMEVKGIVTTFMATVDVIKQAINEGANFIITHEPTWFTGDDQTDWVENDPVYIEKRKLINENNISIWRFHDHMHISEEDGIYRGLIKEIGWEQYLLPNTKECFQLPKTTLKELSLFFKDKLDMDVVQIVGVPDMPIERVGILVGGGSLGLGTEHMPMEFMHNNNLDVVVCGDITEWTLSAYVRDAAALGLNKSMLVLGHERSEEAGMKHLVEWLQPLVNDISVQFIDAKEPFLYL